MGPSLSSQVWVAGACANKAFSCPVCLLPEGELVWSWFEAAETSHQAAVPAEPEEAQNLLGPLGSLGIGEKANIAFLSKDVQALLLVP